MANFDDDQFNEDQSKKKLDPLENGEYGNVVENNQDFESSPKKIFFDSDKILFYFKKVLIGFFFVVILCIFGFISYVTTYFLQSAKYKKIEAKISENLNVEDSVRISAYAYSDPIIVKGRTTFPNSVNFRVEVVLAYNEDMSKVFDLLAVQRLMIQDQIRMRVSMRSDWPLKASQEFFFKADLKEWLNTLLGENYVQDVFFIDVQ